MTAAMPTSNSIQIGQEEIARRAHEIWEREGYPEGRALEHWLQAEQELQGEGAAPTATAPDFQSDTGVKRPARPANSPKNGQRNRPAMRAE